MSASMTRKIDRIIGAIWEGREPHERVQLGPLLSNPTITNGLHKNTQSGASYRSSKYRQWTAEAGKKITAQRPRLAAKALPPAPFAARVLVPRDDPGDIDNQQMALMDLLHQIDGRDTGRPASAGLACHPLVLDPSGPLQRLGVEGPNMTEHGAPKSRTKRPLWIDAFQRDTRHLAADEVGAYLLILMAMWSREFCGLPADDARLARIARVSRRVWDMRIGGAILPLLIRDGDVVYSKRLRAEAAYVETGLKTQSERKRRSYANPEGNDNADEKDGVSDCKPLKTNDRHPAADTSADQPRNHPNQQPNNPAYISTAPAKGWSPESITLPPNPTFRERLIFEMGGDPVSGMIGPNGRQIGTEIDMIEARRWTALPGITKDTAVMAVVELMHRKCGGPPRTFRYFTPRMQDLSGGLSAPPLEPVAPTDKPAPQEPATKSRLDAIFARLAAELTEKGSLI